MRRRLSTSTPLSRAGTWKNQASPYTEVKAQRLRNVLRTACLRQRMTSEKAQQVLSGIARLPVTVDRAGAPPHDLLAVAVAGGHGGCRAQGRGSGKWGEVLGAGLSATHCSKTHCGVGSYGNSAVPVE